MARGFVNMEWREGLVICGFICLLVVMAMRKRGGGRFPPGPPAWPLIGHLHLFAAHCPHQALARLAHRYGPLLGLRLGQQLAVVVSSPALARHVLLSLDRVFADRPPFDFVSLLFFGTSNGIVFNRSAPLWRLHRKLCVLHLVSSKRMHDLQSIRHQEIRALLLSILDHSCAGSSPIDLGASMSHMSSRLILRLLQPGASIHVGDEDLPRLFKEIEQEAKPTVGDFIPSLSFLDFFRKRRMGRLHTRLDKVCAQVVRQYKDSAFLHEGLLHALLSEKEALAMVQVKSILLDIIGAGIHTTALTIEWAMAELLRNPRCLHRLQTEIDSELGGRKLVCDADLPSLSYLKCIVKEVFRLHPAIPLLIPHISNEECEVQGYTIPAGTLMFVNVWGIGRDESVWPNANEFMPERFEGSDIDLKGQHFELLPFGSGRRICMGLPLALSVVEVTLANLVSCFDWELPNGEACQSIDMHEKRGIAANKATPVIVIPKPRVSRSHLMSNM